MQCAETVRFDLSCALPNNLTGLVSGLFGWTVSGVRTYTLPLHFASVLLFRRPFVPATGTFVGSNCYSLYAMSLPEYLYVRDTLDYSCATRDTRTYSPFDWLGSDFVYPCLVQYQALYVLDVNG